MSNLPNRLPLQPLAVHASVFEGFPVRLAYRGGSPSYVFRDDIVDGVGSDMSQDLLARLNRMVISGVVTLGGSPRSVDLIPISQFYQFCQLNPSPRLDQFRVKVAEILVQISNGAEVRPTLHPEFASTDPQIATLQMMIENRKALISLETSHCELKENQFILKTELASLEERQRKGSVLNDAGEEMMPIQAWKGLNRFRFPELATISTDQTGVWGQHAARLARSEGYKLAKTYVKPFQVNIYPAHIIERTWVMHKREILA